MGLSVVLNNALAGLNVNQQALTVLSQNIANANTPGYSQQVLNLQAVYLDGEDAGVDVEGITRKVDQYLQSAVTQQTSTTGETGVINSYNSDVQLLLGQPGSDNDLTSSITNFFDSMQTLAQSPQDSTAQQGVVTAATSLATQTNQLAEGLQNLRYQADQDIGTDVSAINADLTTLHNLNTAIATASAVGQPIAGLQDTQDQTLNDLAQYINVQTTTASNGTINVYTSGGVTLLDDNLHQMTYTPAGSVNTFVNGDTLSPIQVNTIGPDGSTLGQPSTLVSEAPSGSATDIISSGSLAGLLQMRDQQLPDMLSQLDTLTSNLRDEVNAVSNTGSGFPGAASLTGTTEVNASDYSEWDGSVRIAVLGSDGQPISSPYGDSTGVPPLTLNLSTLNTGGGTGQPSVQGIINAINQYYGAPQNKVELGNLNNIQLMSQSTALPNPSNQFTFGFNLQNLSSSNSSFFVTGVQVLNDDNQDITSVDSNVSSIGVSSYLTTADSNVVTVNTSGSTSGLTNGEQVYLSDPGEDIDNIPEADMTGVFTISNVTASSFQITAAASAENGTTTGVTGVTALPPYGTVDSGDQATTGGQITASLGASPDSSYYTVNVNALVTDANGNTSESTISYRITNNQTNLLNTMYGAQSATGDGTVVAPTSSQPLAVATLVDADGNPLPMVNGQYVTSENGYLKITASSGNAIAIDSMNSAEEGQPNNVPPVAGTGDGFSYYFGLNNFFVQPSGSDAVTNSALNLQVNQNLVNDPSLLPMGNLVQTSSADANTPAYNYERDIGDGSIMQALANLSGTSFSFAPSGGLGASSQSFDGYAGQIITAASTTASTAQTTDTNAQSLLSGYQQQSSSVSGVNLDTELANTIIYQNAYTASARVLTVTDDLFTTLLQSFTS